MGYHEKDCDGGEEEAKKVLGWGLWLKASPRKEYVQHLSEEVVVLKCLKKLFVSKSSRSSPSSSSNKVSSALVVKVAGFDGSAKEDEVCENLMGRECGG